MAALTLQPAAAQDRTTDTDLEALIPDSAIAAPAEWVQQHAPPAGPAIVNADSSVPAAGAPDPASPLADGAGFTLPWPDEALDIPELAAVEPDASLADAFAEAPQLPVRQRREGDIEQVSKRLTLVFPADDSVFPERQEFLTRFEGLSQIEQLSGNGEDNLAQLAVRARTDAELLTKLLRIYGYYDSDVTQTVGGIEIGAAGSDTNAGARVRFDIQPGTRYRLGAIDLGRLADAGPDTPLLRDSFEVRAGDPLYTDKIIAEKNDLDIALGENGYAFAKLDQPDLLVDHRRDEGDLTQPVTPGGKYAFGQVTSNLPKFLSGAHLQEISRFEPGDVYKRSEVDDLRRAILATGLVSSAIITPRETRAPQPGTPGEVALDVELSKAPVRTIAGLIGYDTRDGPRIEASWEHRNLFPPEGLLRVRGIAGTKEQLAGVTFRRNNFKGRDQVLTADLFANTVQRDAYNARTVGFTATFEKLTTLIFQKPWTWSGGIELLATREREGSVDGANTPRTNYFVAALPLRVAYDASDNLLDPTRGFRAALRVSPETSRNSGTQANYARIQADASYYQPLGERLVVAARARLGSIPGAAIDDIAPSRRFYAGGGGSVRGYGFQQIGPRNALDEPGGGRALSEFSLEARVKTGFFGGALGVVPFVDAGAVDRGSTPSLRDVRIGAGLGIRYQTGFGPIRIDVGTPLNPRPGDSRVAVYVALGQAF